MVHEDQNDDASVADDTRFGRQDSAVVYETERLEPGNEQAEILDEQKER